MTDRTFTSHIKEAMELKAQIAMLKAQLDAHTDKIKDEMTARGIDHFQHGKADNKITVDYKEVAKSRLDQKRFKADMPELAEQYTIKTTEMRFTMKH